ncbi:hypothetical protein EDEG_02550 [Edhazardia aedis USNM 41457]|uniref:Uncharacterized protein n=1 Tax=Edhazardia aedis (strain USNM 41457) TaxID=1003232 RepID=J9D5N7_EDHAE|nr:hypothetical protein EDEG_02550 [Edhazardia aedis USNM 41457]|eukprot:EJW03071.1 hypothetical protein EDEG_02550 [Edhazardia aedis USNM 41457]
MIILPSLKASEKPEITYSPDENRLKLRYKKIQKFSVRQKVPMNFYVLETTSKPEILINNQGYKIKKAQYHYVTNVIEKEEEENKDVKLTFKDLQMSFGSTKMKRILAKSTDEDTAPKKRTILTEYKYNEQILPPVDLDAKKYLNCYDVGKIFSEDFLEAFNELDYEKCDLSSRLRQLCDYKSQKPGVLLILDSLFRVLSERRANIYDLRELGIFKEVHEIFSDFLLNYSNGKCLTDFGRDKLSVIYYILVLKITSNRAEVSDFPMFFYKYDKFKLLLQTIGCTVSEQSIVLTSKPKLEVVQKRRASKRFK